MIYIPFMATPSFILLSLSTVYEKKEVFSLFYIQLLSLFLMLFLSRRQKIMLPIKKENVRFFEHFSFSIQKSFQTLGIILVYLILVYVCIAIATLHVHPKIAIPFYIASEFASGCFSIETLDLSLQIKLLFTSFLLSYGGLCVHLQLIGTLSFFHYKTFMKYRLLHIFIALLLTYFFTIKL